MLMMQRCFILTLLLLTSAVPLVRGQQRPLQTDDPEPVPAGHVRLQLGMEFLQDQTFRLSGLQGDRTRIGVVGLFVGAGPAVEFQFTGSLVNTLNIERRSPPLQPQPLDFTGNSTSSVGDFTLGAKFRLLSEQASRPAIAFRFGVEMPNASNESGLGNDQTNFAASMLAGKSMGRFRLAASAGIAILGDPTAVSAQNDLFTYGLAGTYDFNPRWSAVGEIHGRTGPGGPGTDDQAMLRLGARYRSGPWRWDVAGVAGFAAEDPAGGVVFGVTYEFRAFR